MKNKILIISNNRSEFGLLSRIILDASKDNSIVVKTVISGTHVNKKFGNTVNEVRKIIKKKDIIEIKFQYKKTNDLNNSRFCSTLIYKFSTIVNKFKPHFIIIFGDRFETLAFAYVANLMRVNVIHIGGGEKTAGSVDDHYRNAISKLSSFHFVTHKEHMQRLMQLGENKKKIFISGSPGIDVIKKTKLLNKKSLEKKLGFNFEKDQTLLVSFYPEANNIKQDRENVINLLNALKLFTHFKIIFTLPNIDSSSDIIIKEIKNFKKKYKQVFVYKSLGSLKFLSLLKNVNIFIGNSSSGLIEAPMLKTKVLNIGKRQEGRVAPNGIWHCKNNTRSIIESIKKVLKVDKVNYKNIYPNIDTSQYILKKIKHLSKDFKIKKFVDYNIL
jgi:GDP/UDP-N,N'-diacetylbacillosamine 2-epimerase (hydrolysing)